MSMVQVAGSTYRIQCRRPGTYDAVRLLDDVRVGSFGSGPPLHIDSLVGGEALLREIAQTAIRAAQTLWHPARAH